MISASSRLSRCLPVLVVLIVGTLWWTSSRLRDRSSELASAALGIAKHGKPGAVRPKWKPGMCNVPEIEYLRRPELGLTTNIVYSRRCIKPTFGKPDRNVVANITRPLITGKTNVNLSDCAIPELPPCDDLPLQVSPVYPSKEYPHLIFGVASTYDRIRDSLPAFSHWLSGTGAQLVGIIADADEKRSNYNLTKLEEVYKSAGVLATFTGPKMKKRIYRQGQKGEPTAPPLMEHHHFLLVQELLALATPGVTEWLAILDDDTFFPSLYPLDAELARHDHTTPLWLGALSDDFQSIRNWGYMAYGGAGVFISVPLAELVAPQSERCLREATTETGDGILRDCIYSQSRAVLTIVPGLYQHDFRGDPSGFFESAPHVLSLHHWKSWYRAPVAAMARVATAVCGDCFLQRWRLGDDTVLANGYSIAVYRKGVLDKLDLTRVEGTWLHPTRDFDMAYGTLREKLERKEKKSYLLKDAVVEDVEGEGRVFRQFYVHSLGEAWEDASGPDEVIELVWEL
ncbi:hypothetical protein B0T25DRAFT_460724 [Lasiosphaeria hispida]|uniref:Glycosyltransferase family 31 protein n=1 Tax=Lasiosphaeria hispida TaxID=260671 RepID=A0AAJ0MAG8_9PEZI|nr:hypothetical protein B0T25DRAFT_460724 [Lasiosphaeria hispida]